MASSKTSSASLGSEDTEITIAHVARAAGVSVSTVSRILNDKPDVAQATRQRVQQVIDELGYMPHAQAQRLAAGRSRTIALLYPMENRAFSHLELDFIVGAAAAAGEENFFFNLMTEPVTESRLRGLYRSAQVDGVILMQINLQDWRVDFLHQNKFPFIIIGRCADNTGLSYLDLDFEGAALTAIEHLAALGHQHVAFFNGSTTLRERKFGPTVRSLDGYRRADRMYEVNLSYREIEATVTDIFEVTLQVLEEHPQVTAIYATHNATSVGIFRALRHLGQRVPDDFSVITIATDQIAQLMTPPLTTIDFPTQQVGYQAAKMLIRKLKNEPLEADQILLPPQIIVRQSTGQAKQ